MVTLYGVFAKGTKAQVGHLVALSGNHASKSSHWVYYGWFQCPCLWGSQECCPCGHVATYLHLLVFGWTRNQPQHWYTCIFLNLQDPFAFSPYANELFGLWQVWLEQCMCWSLLLFFPLNLSTVSKFAILMSTACCITTKQKEHLYGIQWCIFGVYVWWRRTCMTSRLNVYFKNITSLS